ncbi:MAG TPA: flagellar biosynthetic protein FliO [Candidatus Cloacimonadota bacterium]|jgi:flagellar biogenesis protein FliO|nr:flagellar biosynthetic protein FliO [Candidatus Cloacimonadales bacterium]HPY96341.1 flagellar biosynthetic protein FliO [Candidatus Cloacimonadota bacterium]HQB40933.1 flagellar biosynthetic protein FliO [Candidatus Cloacimonadota bacterium]
MKSTFFIIFLLSFSILFSQIDSTALHNISFDTLYTAKDSVEQVWDAGQVSKVNSPSFGWMMFKMLFGLAIISLLLYLVLKFVKSLNHNLDSNTNSLINIIESHPLAYKQYMQIVKVNKKIYVVLSNQNSIQVIDKIDNQDDIDEIINFKSQKANADFLKYFEKFRKPKG